MTPTVDVCNLALSLVGQAATISSVDPPEGSVYARLCAQMYPLALGELLESHAWGFATLTSDLAPLAEVRPGFVGVFALPADCLRVWQVRAVAGGEPIDYERQAGAEGTVLCTQTSTASVLYTRSTNIPQLLPPMLKLALAHLLAAMVAGPIIKGDTGAATAKSLRQIAQTLGTQAAASDATQKLEPLVVEPPWLKGRN